MLTKLTKHDNHPVRIHLTQGKGPHYAALRCVLCNCHIQWLNRAQAEQIKELINEENNVNTN